MQTMIPDISDNPTFLRYDQILRVNPSSIVFAPLAEMLILHKCCEEAITVCKKGLEQNPDLISGRVALARAYVGVLNYQRAKEEAEIVLKSYPDHSEADEILKVSENHLSGNKSAEKENFIKTTAAKDDFAISRLNPVKDGRWYTPTMAEIYASQGNVEMAKKIYKGLLEKNPGDTRAREGLDKLVGIGE